MVHRLACLTAVLAACSTEPVPEHTRSSGSLALSADDRIAFAADADNGTLQIVDVVNRKQLASIPVGQRPENVIAGRHGEAYVANRGSRSVTVVRKTDLGWQAMGEVPVGAEPTGLALSPDGKTLAVANLMSGTVSLVDTASFAVTGEIKAGRAPRAVGWRGNSVYVADYFGTVRVLDPSGAKMERDISLAITATKIQGPFGGVALDARRPSHVTSLAVGPDGKRIYVAHAQCKDDLLPAAPVGGGSAYYGGAIFPVVTPAVTTIEDDAVVQEPSNGETCGIDSCVSDGSGGSHTPTMPPQMLHAPIDTTTFDTIPISMPSAAVVHPDGHWLFVANVASNNVAVISTERAGQNEFMDAAQGIHSVVKVGSGPTGIAVSNDGRLAIVHNAFDHSLSFLTEGDAGKLVEDATVSIGASPLTPAQQRGRTLFYGGDDERMTTSGIGMACVSCHGDGGRVDAHTWKFQDGARNTPTLAYRELAQTAPFHWDGALSDLNAFQVVITERMGGHGLTRGEFDDLSAFLTTLPEADNPHRRDTLSPEQELGKRLFEDPAKANCVSCHTGQAYTDNALHDAAVGSRGGMPRIATPPLRGVFATAPYRHDGSAPTLNAVLTTPGAIAEMNMNGKLSSAEIDALVAYLETL